MASWSATSAILNLPAEVLDPPSLAKVTHASHNADTGILTAAKTVSAVASRWWWRASASAITQGITSSATATAATIPIG
jgi:hypothetical protein